MRRLLSILLGIVLLAAGVVLGVTLARQLSDDESGSESAPEKPDLGTTAVIRTDLVERRSFEASLEFADRRILAAVLPGTVTGLPAGGEVLGVGDTFIELDGAPVVILRGGRPMWRPMFDGVAGADVLQLEQNLAELGFLTDGDEPVEPDDEFDDVTADAVEAWRAEVGLDDDTQVELGRVLFVEEPIRIGEVLASEGDLVGAGVPMIEVTAPDQDVVLQLPVDDRDLVAVGDTVVVVLPGDVETTGSVREVSRIVSQVPGPVEPSDVVEVTIDLDEPGLAGDIDRAPVDVELESGRAEGVLAVPVNALLALADGGYAVQVMDGEDRVLVGVEIGTFLDTLVEVEGDLSEGDIVVVPR